MAERFPAARRQGAGPAALLLAAALAAWGPAPAAAQEWTEFRAARQPHDLEALTVEVVYGAGRLAVEPTEGNYLYDVRLLFDAARFSPVRTWSRTGESGTLRVGLTSVSSDSKATLRLGEDVTLNLDRLDRLGDAAGRLEVALGRTVPTDLKLTVGAAETALELGGIPLAGFAMETGASTSRLSFGEANPVAMDRLSLKVGAAEFRAEKLGNADFQSFAFEGGVGDVFLDFSGDWKRSARGTIKMGVGALSLRFPREIGVRIRKSSFLTAFDASGFTQVGNAYQTANWDDAATRLELDLDAAFGAITVHLVP